MLNIDHYKCVENFNLRNLNINYSVQIFKWKLFPFKLLSIHFEYRFWWLWYLLIINIGILIVFLILMHWRNIYFYIQESIHFKIIILITHLPTCIKETKCPQNMTSLVPVASAFHILIFALMTHSQIISQVSLMVLGKSQLL